MNAIVIPRPATVPVLVSRALAVTLALLFLLAYLYTIPAEDAVILYDYAKNLASRGVITYSVHAMPIEGATDFLWMVVIAGLKAIGVDEFASAMVLNAIGVLLVLHAFREPKERILVGVALLLTPYLYASLNGFSAIFFSAWYVLVLRWTLTGSRHVYLSVLVLCLIRPDGVVWGAGCLLYRAITGSGERRLGDEIRNALLFLVLPGVLYFAWRWWYFGELLPLPFLVKAAAPRDLLLFYSDSVRDVLMVLLPGALAILLSSRRKRLAVEFLALFILPAAFYSAMRLEQNIGNRFLAPMFAGIAFLLAQSDTERRAFAAFLALAIVAQFKLTVVTFAELASSRQENIYGVSKDLGGLQGRMLVTEAGRLAYYSNWFAEDSWGLDTPRYAHALITPQDVSQGRYDLIVAHCELAMLRPGTDLAHDRSRTWHNQCRSMAAAIREGPFDVYLVPFYDGITMRERVKLWMKRDAAAAPCLRHDIYAVSKQYAQAGRLESILARYGARKFDPRLEVQEDMVCGGGSAP
jgi:hypothetical protein